MALLVTNVRFNMNQRRLADALFRAGRPEVMHEVGRKTKDYFNTFVPKSKGTSHEGRLRKSAKVEKLSAFNVTISWGAHLKYANYQYGGIVYGPNFPVFVKNEDGSKTFKGWSSRKGKGLKHPTGRELGVPGEVTIKSGKTEFTARFGYSTPGTKHHWLDEGRRSSKYRVFRRGITSYMEKELKEALREL